MKEATKPRLDFLKSARKGTHAVDYFPPVKWATAKGYVTLDEGRMGGDTYHITPEGEAFLRRAGEA
jgi:hypothetical protein